MGMGRCGCALLYLNKNSIVIPGGNSNLLWIPLFHFSDTASLYVSGMASNHSTSPQDDHLPHYLQDEDPFASKLSREADIVAGFYLTIIGKAL